MLPKARFRDPVQAKSKRNFLRELRGAARDPLGAAKSFRKSVNAKKSLMLVGGAVAAGRRLLRGGRPGLERSAEWRGAHIGDRDAEHRCAPK